MRVLITLLILAIGTPVFSSETIKIRSMSVTFDGDATLMPLLKKALKAGH